MKFLATWSVRPGALKTAVDRFLAGEAAPRKGVTLLGRWFKVDSSGGASLYETDNPSALFEGAAAWTDLLDIHTSPVIEDAEAGAVMVKVFKQ